MITFGLPDHAEIGGKRYEIRADFRDILQILCMMTDPDMPNQDKALAALMIFYPDFDTIPPEKYKEAMDFCSYFIDGGETDTEQKRRPRLMDWEQDYQYIIAPVNRVLGYETRSRDFVHWWTFLSAYREIGDCTFARIVSIRDKKRRGKKLDKVDQDFYRDNRNMIDLKQRTSEAEMDIMKEWGGTPTP